MSSQSPKRKRHRSTSLEAEIRVKARAIIAEREAEAYKAAALMICSRKLDEIKSILQSVGLTPGITAMCATATSGGILPGVRQNLPVVQIDPEMPGPGEPACFQCGRRGVKQARRTRWDPVGRWACPAHIPLIQQTMAEDNRDAALMGPQAVMGATPKRPVVITHAPAKMVTETPVEPEVQIQPTSTGPQDAPGAATMDDAMRALGV